MMGYPVCSIYGVDNTFLSAGCTAAPHAVKIVAGGGAWRPCYLNTQSAVSALDHGTFCISLHTFFLWPDHCQANLIYLTLHCNIELEMRSRVVFGYNLNV